MKRFSRLPIQISSPEKTSEEKRASFIHVLRSVAASMIGVQSDKNRQFDFEQTSFLPYLIVGVLFVLFFVLGLVALVNVILA